MEVSQWSSPEREALRSIRLTAAPTQKGVPVPTSCINQLEGRSMRISSDRFHWGKHQSLHIAEQWTSGFQCCTNPFFCKARGDGRVNNKGRGLKRLEVVHLTTVAEAGWGAMETSYEAAPLPNRRRHLRKGVLHSEGCQQRFPLDGQQLCCQCEGHMTSAP